MYVRQVLSDPRARPKPCLRCERSLLNHLDDRFCPDCGLSVWMSLNPNDALDRSRPEWLRHAAQGAWLLAVAQPIALAAYLLAFLGRELPAFRDSMVAAAEFGDGEDAGAIATTQRVLAHGTSANDAVTDSAAATQAAVAVRDAARAAFFEPSVPVAIALALIGVFFLIAAVGLWRVSDEERRYPDRQRTARRAVRIVDGVVLLVGILTLSLGLTHLTNGWPAHTMQSYFLLLAVEITFGAVACVGWLYLTPIARRGGRSGLAKLCGYLLFLPLLTFAKAAPFIGLWFLYLLLPLATLLPLAYLPLSTVLFVKFARMLGRAAPHAQAAWDAESRPAEAQVVAA